MPTVIAGGIITLEYAAAGLAYAAATVGQPSYAARDADLAAYIQAATPVIENIVGAVVPRIVVERYDGGADLIVLRNRATSISAVTVAGVATADYTFDPDSSILYAGGSFLSGRQTVEVTYTTGFTTIPATLQLATRELVRFWVQQGNQSQRPAFGDAVESAAYTPQGFAVPKRVMELCAPYRTMGGFA